MRKKRMEVEVGVEVGVDGKERKASVEISEIDFGDDACAIE